MPGKRLDESKRECVRKLHEYFQKELANGGPLLPLNAIQEEKIKNARKKLHEKLTNTYPSDEQLFDIHIGDSYDATPTNSFSDLFERHDRYEKNDVSGISDARRKYLCKRKSSAPALNARYKPERQDDKTISKYGTNTQLKIIMTEHVFEKKFKSFVEKSLQTLGEIRNLLEKGIEQPDGDEDISRRKLRVKEFSNRFSRNYLYPIVRQIDDLSRYKQPHASVNKKILSAYHVIHNGLVAYHSHLPSSIGACSSDKLKLLLKHSMDLCEIHSKILPIGDENGYNDFIQSFKQNAEVTLQKVDQFTNYTEIVTSLQLSTPHFRTEHKGTKPTKKPKPNLENRLSMYSTTTIPKKNSLWKRAAEVFGKKRFSVKSRYKTAQFKHRPPMERIKTEMLTVQHSFDSNCKLLTKKSSEFKKMPDPSPINEDNICTLVQMESNLSTRIQVEDKEDENAEKKDAIKRERYIKQ